jgi:carboxymethylenebutenolidase
MDKDRLIARWEAHLGSEMVDRDVDATMNTMTPTPYVNHVPTMTGGVGAAELRRFYKHHFIPVNPPDFEVVPVSRTVGADTLVDELVLRFTHSCRMNYFLPGVAPTNRRVEFPLVVIAHFEGDLLAHEHIYWDQASVLVQVGLLERGNLPITGVEATQKVLEPDRPSNGLMFREWAESEPDRASLASTSTDATLRAAERR